MKNSIKKFLPILVLLLILIPVLTFGQGGFIPCGGKDQHPCGYYDLLQLINNIIKWIMMVSVPVAAGVFAWAGFLLMTSEIVDQKTHAKDMIWKVFIGLVFILSAWLLVSTLMKALATPAIINATPVELR